MVSQNYNYPQQGEKITVDSFQKRNNSDSELWQPKQGEIWLIDYTFNFSQINNNKFEIESQIKKLRPSIILSNNIQNEFNNRIIVAPLTSKSIEIINKPFEILIEKEKSNGLDQDSKLLLQFLLSIDKNFRLVKKLGKVEENKIREIDKGLEIVFKRI